MHVPSGPVETSANSPPKIKVMVFNIEILSNHFLFCRSKRSD